MRRGGLLLHVGTSPTSFFERWTHCACDVSGSGGPDLGPKQGYCSAHALSSQRVVRRNPASVTSLTEPTPLRV